MQERLEQGEAHDAELAQSIAEINHGLVESEAMTAPGVGLSEELSKLRQELWVQLEASVKELAQAAAASIRNSEERVSAELGGRLQVLERAVVSGTLTPSALAIQQDEKTTSGHQIIVADHARRLETLQHEV